MSIDAFLAAVRAHCDSRGSKGSRSIYAYDLSQWLVWAEIEGVDVTSPDLAEVSRFKDYLGEKQAPLSVRRCLSSLSGMYGAVINRKPPLATWNPFHPKALPRPSSDAYSPTEAIPPEDVQRLIAQAKNDKTLAGRRDEAVLWILYETGLRRDSVVKLKRESIVSREGQTVVKVVVKGAKRREIVLAEESERALQTWLEYAPSSVYVFPAARGGGTMRPETVNKIVADRARAAGVSGAHPHSFRAAFATEALDAGMPLHEVQAAMHHSNPQTTLRYDRGKRGGGVTNALAEYRKGKQ